MSVVILTHFPSPYQVELFDEVQRQRPGAIVVYYLHRTDPTRSWAAVAPRHSARFIEGDPAALSAARADFRAARFAVFNFYAERPVAELLRIRVASGGPWSFWGERPGFVSPTLGRFRRLWKLRALHRSRQPIWGIGRWAVEAYRREFGANRSYVNLPYFSDLGRFRSVQGSAAATNPTFLYSGALSARKGVDILAQAFARIAAANASVRLRIMGGGPLEADMRKVLARFQGQVDWVGFRQWDELPSIYGSSHYLCVPSRHDGWGLVVPEGLASGLPVIGTDRTGAALEFIEPGANGWIVPAGDEGALHAAMDSAVKTSEEKRQAMSANARARVATHTLEQGALRFLDAVDFALR